MFDTSFNGLENDRLYLSPNLLSKTFDILLRFSLSMIGMLADIKRAFEMPRL